MTTPRNKTMHRLAVVLWLMLPACDGPVEPPKVATKVVAAGAMAHAGDWTRAPRIGTCVGKTILCTVPSIEALRGVNADGDTVIWQLKWEPPALQIPDSLSWRYRIEFGGTHPVLSGRRFHTAPGTGLFARSVYGVTESTPRPNVECRWSDVLDMANSVTIRPELVNPQIESRWSHADDKGGRTRGVMPPYVLAGSVPGVTPTTLYRPRCGQGGKPLVHEAQEAAATEFLDYVPPPDTATAESPPPPNTSGGTDTTSAPAPPPTLEGIPRIPIDLQVAVQRNGDVVSDGTVHRGDRLRFSVAEVFADTTNVEGKPAKHCIGAYPYGWYANGYYQPWVVGSMPEDAEEADRTRSSNCGSSGGDVLNPWTHYWGDADAFVPYTFDYEVPTNSLRAEGLCKVNGQDPCLEYWPGLEPRTAKVRCLTVSFVIWSSDRREDGTVDYRRYYASETLAVGPPEPDWTGEC